MNKQPRDFYEVLGIERGANADAIRKAYRRLARQLHPDMNKAPDAAKKFSEVQEAYDVLSDEQKRKSYDRFGHAGVGAAGGGGPPPGWGGGGGTGGAGSHGRGTRSPWESAEGVHVDPSEFADIFEQMFGGGMRGGGGATASRGARGRARRAEPEPGRDIEHAITVTFLTAALGGSEQLRFTSSGEASEINVKIPQGIESGAKLRLKGKGYPGAAGGPPGDLILTVEVGQHPYFRREGLDLLIDVPVNIAEAVRGAKVSVPLLKDGSVELKIPAGMTSGQRLRVPDKGVTDAKGRSGNLYVVVQIVAPALESLSDDGKKSILQLAGELINPRNSPPWVDE